MYVAYSSPHTPLATGPDQKGQKRRGPYGDPVEEMDTSVGKILQTLRDNALDRNTLVVFTSDNGPWLLQGTNGGSAGLLREGKGSTWEGGLREPCLVWWPGEVSAGRVSSDIACTMDRFVTALYLAGALVPGDRPIDGVSLVPMLKGTGPSPRQVMPYFAGSIAGRAPKRALETSSHVKRCEFSQPVANASQVPRRAALVPPRARSIGAT